MSPGPSHQEGKGEGKAHLIPPLHGDTGMRLAIFGEANRADHFPEHKQ